MRLMGPTRHREGTAGEKGPGRCSGTCEDCLAIDVREWQRAALLRYGMNFSCSWSRLGRLLATIEIGRAHV